MTVEYLVIPYNEEYPDYGEERLKKSLPRAREFALRLAHKGQYDSVCIYEDKYDETGELVKSECIDRVWKERAI